MKREHTNMVRAEVGTPKWLGNRMKSKGLQKLRWYCQMCQKQCRDENGFKCHTNSEFHQRQLLLFADNSQQCLNNFSSEFEQCFLDLLKRQYGTKRVRANVVYQEYIRDRNHTHMNATSWNSLTEFCKYLGRKSKVIAEKTEKGWFITYIDRDPGIIKREEAIAKKQNFDKDDQERLTLFIEKQVESGRQTGEKPEHELKKFDRGDGEKIQIKLSSQVKKETCLPLSTCFSKVQSKHEESDTNKNGTKDYMSNYKLPFNKDDTTTKRYKRKCSALDEIMEEPGGKRQKLATKDYWLTRNIVVKIITQSLGDKYYQKKGFITQVIDDYVAIVTMFDTGHTLKLDQAHLETVIPADGRMVKVVNGAYRGYLAVLNHLDVENFCASITINSGLAKGRRINNFPYNCICKIHVA